MNKEWVQVILTESQLDLLQRFNVIRGSENEAYILCLGQFFKLVHNGFGEVEHFYTTFNHELLPANVLEVYDEIIINEYSRINGYEYNKMV